MFGIPAFHVALCPVCAERESNYGDEPCEQGVPEQCERAARKFRFSALNALYVRVFCLPFYNVHAPSYEVIYAERYYAEQEPDYVFAEKLNALAVENEVPAVYVGVFCLPAHFPAFHRGIGKRERYHRNYKCEQPYKKVCKRSARKARVKHFRAVAGGHGRVLRLRGDRRGVILRLRGIVLRLRGGRRGCVGNAERCAATYTEARVCRVGRAAVRAVFVAGCEIVHRFLLKIFRPMHFRAERFISTV